MTDIYERIKTLQMMIELEQSNIAGLEARYGTGVRPAWVGEDIGISHARIDQHKRELAELGVSQ